MQQYILIKDIEGLETDTRWEVTNKNCYTELKLICSTLASNHPQLISFPNKIIDEYFIEIDSNSLT